MAEWTRCLATSLMIKFNPQKPLDSCSLSPYANHAIYVHTKNKQIDIILRENISNKICPVIFVGVCIYILDIWICTYMFRCKCLCVELEVYPRCLPQWLSTLSCVIFSNSLSWNLQLVLSATLDGWHTLGMLLSLPSQLRHQGVCCCVQLSLITSTL